MRVIEVECIVPGLRGKVKGRRSVALTRRIAKERKQEAAVKRWRRKHRRELELGRSLVSILYSREEIASLVAQTSPILALVRRERSWRFGLRPPASPD